MKYRVEKLSATICSIILVPERPAEASLVAAGERHDSFLEHYQQALTNYVHKNAELVGIINKDHYPRHVLVQYSLSSELEE
ncbi:MAG: hypothetical protein EOO15_18600 [Chitinophagaceae bacterium]|nr:MAG: hypothetical protein EOO15_18600 [Chitinophagaceae bacterium]